MIIDGFVHQLPDADPDETREWLDALDQIIDRAGESRARFLMARLIERARSRSIGRYRPKRRWRRANSTSASSNASRPKSGQSVWVK